jgi:hypothetical protein
LTGVSAAVESGAQVVMVPQKHFDVGETHKKIQEVRPRLAALLKSLEDFKPEEFGLPPYN